MTVTNTSGGGNGINMMDAKVELMDVALKGCVSRALYVTSDTSETTVVATRCEFANSQHGAVVEGSLTFASTCTNCTFNNCVFHDNTRNGIKGYKASIHLHGEATAIHSNQREGIGAYLSCKVLIHLPSSHKTSYNNGRDDRFTAYGGTITNEED